MIDHAIRSAGIGASEVSAIFGLHPQMSAWDLWASKSGLLDQIVSEHDSRAAWGRRLEQAIAQGYSEITGRPVEWVDRTLRGAASPIQVYSPDAVCLRESIGIDAKNKGIDQYQHFGEPGTDEVPDQIAIQCHWSISASGRAEWHVAALFGGHDLRIFIVKQDAELEGMLVEAGEKFWRDHVISGIPPKIEDTERANAYLSKKFPRNNGTVRLPTAEEMALIEEYRPVRAEQKRLTKLKADLEVRIQLAIGDCDGLEWGPLKSKEHFTWKRCKDSQTINWESVARGLSSKVSPEDFTALVGVHTQPKPGSRRVHVKFEKEQE